MNADGSDKVRSVEEMLKDADKLAAKNGEGPDATAEPTKKRLLVLVRDDELCARNTPLPPPLIDGYLNRGELAVLAASPKANKSWMALQMAKCIATGTPFLGCEVTKGKCLYLNMEVGDAWWEGRNRMMNAELDVEPITNLWHVTPDEDVEACDVEDLLVASISNAGLDGVDFICVDPLYALAGDADENSAKDMRPVIFAIKKVAKRTGAAVLVVHHFAKGGGTGRDVLDRGAGSNVLPRAADVWMTLTRTNDGKTILESRRRNVGALPPLEVEFDCPIWMSNGESEPVAPLPRGPKSGYDPDAFRRAFPDPAATITAKQLRNALGMPSKTTFYNWIDDAIRGGIITRGSGGTYRLPVGDAANPIPKIPEFPYK